MLVIKSLYSSAHVLSTMSLTQNVLLPALQHLYIISFLPHVIILLTFIHINLMTS